MFTAYPRVTFLKKTTFITAVFLAALCLSASARADSGDLAIGANVGFGLLGESVGDSVTLGTQAWVRLGWLDWLHIDGGAGLRVAPREAAVSPHLNVALTSVLDVFTWVPEFSLGAIFVLDGQSSRVFIAPTVGAALRYHIDATWSVAGGAMVVLPTGPLVLAEGNISFFYAL